MLDELDEQVRTAVPVGVVADTEAPSSLAGCTLVGREAAARDKNKINSIIIYQLLR